MKPPSSPLSPSSSPSPPSTFPSPSYHVPSTTEPSLVPSFSTHPMTTRSRVGITKPNPRYALSVVSSIVSPVPTSHLDAIWDPNWKNAMLNEYKTIITNDPWEFVPRLSGVNVIRCMWVFTHKFHANGSLEWYKARLVVNGRSQQVGVDCYETFSPVVKPATILTVLTLALSKKMGCSAIGREKCFPSWAP
ncbi:uncharacterized protein LOC112519953 [Cynara cardunculus var. scolymus]|uniref:uncharacterized protein LOC112519953 n=1 Tax=Cynara cardunculus var. scolymus TaxID=59895 RepID=UPI000D6262BE|nr:uncharacterized protein LOC112519953 [Cynara cardunculus var. scolymus]